MKKYTDRQLNDAFHMLRKDSSGSLRPDQIRIIRSILSGHDTVAILPTGGGKTVCFQVPALLMKGITIVVSPLTALLQDQVASLYEAGIPAACISGGLIADRSGLHFYNEKDNEEDEDDSPSRRRRIFHIYQDIVRNKNPHPYKLLYVTPERLRNGQFIRFAQRADISFIAVDEAHCISLWGYEFRRRYLEIARLLKRIAKRPVIGAFTATATEAVRDDILTYLFMKKPSVIESAENGTKRNNLSVKVINAVAKERKYKKAYQKDRMRMIRSYAKAHSDQCGIIYCQNIAALEEMYTFLNEDPDLSVTRYYASLEEETDGAETRQQNLNEFIQGEKKIIVATNALGMGFDKNDIRYVLHAGMPLSMENYWQEAGRAGRDGLEAECIIYCLPGDTESCRHLILRSLEDSGLEGEVYELRRRTAYDRLNKMKDFCDQFMAGSDEDPQDEIENYFRTFRPKISRKNITKMNDYFLKEIREIDVLYSVRTKIASEIRKGNTAGKNLSVSSRRKELTADYELSSPLTSFDLLIADAVYTLIRHGITKIYPRNILELLTGDHQVTMRPERRQQIENRIRHMCATHIRIDMSCSMNTGFFYDDQRRSVIEGAFLPLKDTGKGFECGPFELPPLYEYAEIMNGQFHSIPLHVLRYIPSSIRVPDVFHTTVRDQLLRGITEGTDITVNRRDPALRASFTVSKQLNVFDLNVMDAVSFLMKYPEEPDMPFNDLTLSEILTVMNENGMVIEKADTEEKIRESVEDMRNIAISLTLNRVSDAGTECLFQTADKVLPLDDYENILYFYAGGVHPPLYDYGLFLENLYGREKPETAKAHTSFLNIALLHYLLRRIESVTRYPSWARKKKDSSTGETVTMISTTTPRIRFETMLDSLSGLLDEKDRNSPRIRRELFAKELRMLKHLKMHGYLKEFKLADEEYTVAFTRYVRRNEQNAGGNG